MTNNSVNHQSTAVQEITWDDFMDANIPTSSHQQRWQQAVARTAEAVYARTDIRVDPERLQRAMDLVLAGKVLLHDDGTATVTSGTHTYDIQGDCTCQDAQHRSKYCKHYLATRILRGAYEQLASPNGHHTAPEPPTHAPEPPEPAQQAQAWECAQAPSSCTLKWGCGGVELMLTLRDATDKALFDRIRTVLPRIKDTVDAERQQRRDVARTRKDDEAAQADTAAHFCVTHDVPFTRKSKGNHVWYSHWDDDTQAWCRERR